MTPSALLLAYGWIQGRYGDESSGFCLEGALLESARTDPARYTYGVTRAKVEARLGGANLLGWNDAPGRTLDEVLALLREEKL